jgi:O-antigen/teichoic acid export membrane protein
MWIIAKLPEIYHLRAQGSLGQIARIFRQRISLALLTFVVGAIVLLSLGQNLLLHLHAQTFLLPGALLALLLIIQLLEMHHALYGELVYSENVNPFVRPALISGASIVILSLVLTPRFGLWGMLLATGAVQLCFNNWWPVRRAIRGLGPVGRNYWRGFIFAPQPNADADDRSVSD